MPYDFGDVVPLRVTVRDANGDPAAAGAVSITVTLPDQTTAAPTVTTPSTGVYLAQYQPTQAGRHAVTYVATGANASAYTDVFDVRPATSTNLLSLEDARATLNLSATTDDEELRSYIEAVTSLIEARIGPVVPRTVVETVSGRNYLLLSETPVVSVTSIAGIYPDSTTLSLVDLTTDSATGTIGYLSRAALGGTYTVTYVAGRTGIIPPRITQAARVLLKHLWSTQRGGRPTTTASDADGYAQAYSMPNRVLELLATDMRAPGVA